MGNVAFTILVALLTAGSGGTAVVGTFSSIESCKNEIARLEAEDKAKVAEEPLAPQVSVVRQCMRKS